MYDEFRKPGILRHIPVSFIRALPCIYYYNYYRNNNNNEKIKNLVDSNIDYLDEALVFISNRLDIQQFKDISRLIYRLKKDDPSQYGIHYRSAIEKLSCVCECHIDKIKEFTKSEKNKLNEIYNNNILKLKILYLNISRNMDKHKKINSILKNNCNYDVESTIEDHSDFSDMVLNSDLVIFDSTYNSKIHQLMKNLTSYNKPGIALVPLVGNNEDDRISLRHGNQLRKQGYHIIYKSFTPIRLFTSIDREYLKYNLNKQ